MPFTKKMIRRDFPDAEKIDIYGLSDMHIGHEGFNEAEFNRFVRFVLEDEHRYVVLVGDLVDNQVKSSVGSPYEATMRPRDQREKAVECLKPLRERVLGGVKGNHCEKSVKDTDTDPFEMIMKDLDLADVYERDQLYLDIGVGRRTNHKNVPPNYAICAMHGKSGGKTAGGGLTSVDYTAATSGADLFITGHTHKPAAFAGARLLYDRGKKRMVQRAYQIMICSSWLDYVGYGVRGMYRPSPISIARATLFGGEYSIETHNRTF